jgi:hypothetical protein
MATQKKKFLTIAGTLFVIFGAIFIWQMAALLESDWEPPLPDDDHGEEHSDHE